MRAAGGATVRRGMKVLDWLVTLGTDDPRGLTSLQLVSGRPRSRAISSDDAVTWAETTSA